MIKSMTSSITPPTSSTASAAPPTMPPRKSATRKSPWTKARHCARSLTASIPTALRKKFSNTCRWTASTFPGPASCLSSPGWTANTLCTWPTVSARRICGSGRTTCGSCATPPTRATARYCGATRAAPTTKYKERLLWERKYALIARLDVKDTNLVKGIQLEGLRKLGDPNRFAKRILRAGHR